MTSNNPYIIENENISIDVSILYDVSGNDESFINKMVQTFLKSMPETIEKIEQSLRNQDWENVYKSAHSAKSPLSIIKVDKMFEWILQVEINAKNQKDLDKIPDLLEMIKEKYRLAELILIEKFKIKADAF